MTSTTQPSTHPVDLAVEGYAVARYETGDTLDSDLSPRPYLHPVRARSGVVMTEVEPADHRHHYGVSNAIADINGTTYWGGASYVHPQGYTMLPNQGRQEILRSTATPESVSERLSWVDEHGQHQLTEDRLITASSVSADAWALRWHSTLIADAGDLALGSPATRGRTGAGYGGLFWRLSPESIQTRVVVPDGEGESAAHGSVSPWLLLEQERAGATVAVLLVQGEDLLPWFVRIEGYVGAGPAVAWADHHHVPKGSEYRMSLAGVILDNPRGLAEVDAIARAQRELLKEHK